MDAPFLSPDLRFIAPLGRGGTADVARVYSSRLGRDMAAKYPLHTPTEVELDFAKLADREYELIGRSRFPGLVKLLEAPSHDPDYLLLELCEGPTLDTVGRVDCVLRACNLISAAAIVLEYLNATGLIHGDLKPSNYFLPVDWQERVDAGLFRLRLSDFSLGRKYTEPDSERLGVGTVGFMAPETIAEFRTSHRSDLFALGVIAYQLLTGRHPFMEDDADPVKVSSRVREGDYPAVTEFRSDIPEALEVLIDDLLEVDESKRPSSAWEVCERLESTGATYPFRRTLSPGHCVARHSEYEEFIESMLDCSDRDRNRLDTITEGDVGRLRLILTANFARGMVVYREGRFIFGSGIYWPSCLRRETARRFAALDFKGKRAAIRTAARLDILFPRDEGAHDSSPLSLLLHGMLRPATIRRLVASSADQRSTDGDYLSASELYLKAGDLQRAMECADQAALSLEEAGDQRSAYTVLNAVISYAELLGKVFDIRRLYMTRGDIEKRAGDVEEALATYQTLVQLYEGRAHDKLLAEAHKDLGDVYKMKQQTDEGLASLEKAQRIFSELGDELELSHTLNNMGNLYWLRGDARESRAVYLRALRIQRRMKAEYDIASSLSNLASTYAYEGRYTRARALFTHALGAQRSLGDSAGLARTLNNLGYTTLLMGDSEAAVAYLTESLETNRRIGSKKEVLFNFVNLTAVMITAGRLRDSLAYLQEGMSLAEQQGDRPHRAEMHISMGTVYKRLGRIRQALEELALGERLAADVDDFLMPASIAIQRASIRLIVGDREGALGMALETARETEARSLPYERLNALLLASRVSPDLADLSLVESLCDQLHLPRERHLSRFSVLEAALESDDRERITRSLDTVLAIDKPLPEHGDIETARMGSLIGEALLETEREEDALLYLEQARVSATINGLLPELVAIHTLLGRYYATRNEYETCYAQLRKGLQYAKQVAESIDSPEDRAMYQSQRLMTYLVTQIKQLGSVLNGR